MRNINRQLGQVDPVTLLLSLLLAYGTLLGSACPSISIPLITNAQLGLKAD